MSYTKEHTDNNQISYYCDMVLEAPVPRITVWYVFNLNCAIWNEVETFTWPCE